MTALHRAVVAFFWGSACVMAYRLAGPECTLVVLAAWIGPNFMRET